MSNQDDTANAAAITSIVRSFIAVVLGNSVFQVPWQLNGLAFTAKRLHLSAQGSPHDRPTLG
jgi:hypothetical protein